MKKYRDYMSKYSNTYKGERRGDQMQEKIVKVIIGSLFHDIGKVIYRSGGMDGRAHSISGAEWVARFTQDKDIIDCIRNHHYQEIKQAELEKDSLAYVVYLADNISAGADRREIEGEATKGFDQNKPLGSIYNLLHGRNGREVYPVAPMGKDINYPYDPDRKTVPVSSSAYAQILADFGDGMKGIDFSEQYVNSLLELCEAYLCCIPSSTSLGEVTDISLFDHAKITAALASAIVLYLDDWQREDYRLELLEKGQNFYQENAFALLSFDISGIQQFIYTISSKGALKGLRARSFYLEIFLENLADEILRACSLSRANLLYSGGGHAYILLPNTAQATEGAEQAIDAANRGLRELFGHRLFIAHGIQACSANELMSKTEDPESYSNVFRSVSALIAARKLRRYSPEELLQLNEEAIDQEGRECAVCGQAGNLEEREGDTVCSNCAAFTDISGMLIKKDIVFAVLKKRLEAPALTLFSAQGGVQYLHPLSLAKAKELLKNRPEQLVRIYSKNAFHTGLSLATKLWLGDLAAKNEDGSLKTFRDLAKGSAGIKRIGVLRADVDDLGTAFVSGFQRKAEDKNRYRYVTISRTASFSRSISIFFKYYINEVLEAGENHLLPKKGDKNLVIVYAGGDDLFLVGAWDEVLSAGINLRRAFKRYTGGALTLSAGMGIFTDTYPISRMAKETEILENCAKDNSYAGGEKNSISLFGMEFDKGLLVSRHTYDWDTFEKQVLGEKYAGIAAFFDTQEDYGSSFLYNILYLLHQAGEDRINIARLAYLLARREPGPNALTEEKEGYAKFSRNLYQWALVKEDRRQLITALILYIYSRREEKEEK
ncbi:MAG: type III-A CRISPR-associated protein Cas10/Csm1 [Peptococcaceae bacterium]|nr:type III-A CRISPR-associated protein Cas10/Csm1 [Peptococcaceae bacterium]